MIMIKYGPGNSTNLEDHRFATIRELLEDRNLQAILGFGTNVTALVNGLSGVETINPGDTIDLVSRGNTKARNLR